MGVVGLKPTPIWDDLGMASAKSFGILVEGWGEGGIAVIAAGSGGEPHHDWLDHHSLLIFPKDLAQRV
jgi:hypothetical protein